MLSFSAKHNLPQFQNLKKSLFGSQKTSIVTLQPNIEHNVVITDPLAGSASRRRRQSSLWKILEYEKSLECWNAIIIRNRESSISSQHKRALQPLIDVNNFQCLAQELLSTQNERDDRKLNESARCCELWRWEEDEPQWISFTQFTQKNCAMIVICPNLSFALLSPFMLSAWFNELINRMGTS